MERDFLNGIQFGTTFKASEYAKFYFALRELSDVADEEALPTKPLSRQQQDDLEKKSSAFAKQKQPEQPLARSASLSHFVSRADKAAAASSE